MSYTDEPEFSEDEGDPAILEALPRIADIIEEIHAVILERLDEEREAHYVTRRELRSAEITGAKDTRILALVRGILDDGERRRLRDADVMARIRGALFHG